MFEPWVGGQWGQDTNALNGFKLFVLGESHHGDADDIGKQEPSLTNEVVEYYLDGGQPRAPWTATFSRITGVISGRASRQVTWTETRALWDSLVFYNYVPVIAAGGPRERPSAAHFALGPEPLKVVLKRTEPDAILVCGKELSGWVARGEGFERAWDLTSYDIQGTPAAMIHHPSTALSYDRWRPVVRDLIERARSRATGTL